MSWVFMPRQGSAFTFPQSTFQHSFPDMLCCIVDQYFSEFLITSFRKLPIEQ